MNELQKLECIANDQTLPIYPGMAIYKDSLRYYHWVIRPQRELEEFYIALAQPVKTICGRRVNPSETRLVYSEPNPENAIEVDCDSCNDKLSWDDLTFAALFDNISE